MPGWTSFVAFLAEAERAPENQRQQLVDDLLRERKEWPWIEGNLATFIYANMGTTSAALNLDTIKDDPPFAVMTNLPGTTLWHVTRQFEPDALLDYLLAINDPMTPLATEPDIVKRVAQHWRTDPLNPLRMTTPQMDVSVLHMSAARPFPDWSRMYRVPHGRVNEHLLDSDQLNFRGRKLWVYTPPDYDKNAESYPLLIFQDGQWASGPLQLPYIADALIKHKRVQPLLMAMVQSAAQQERNAEYLNNDRHVAFLEEELLPFLRNTYRINSTIGIGGVAAGAAAAIHAALTKPTVFSRLIMISPPLGGRAGGEERVREGIARIESAEVLPQRIFQSVGRYETPSRFYRPALQLRVSLEGKAGVAYKFAEIGSGHGLVGFRSVLPEALAWIFPGSAFELNG